MADAMHGADHHGDGETRRDFLMMTTAAMAAVGAGAAIWPLVDSLNPAADALAVSSVEIDLDPIAVGQAVTIMWRGTPVFIRHRTAKEIEDATNVALGDLPEPAGRRRTRPGATMASAGRCLYPPGLHSAGPESHRQEG